MKVVRPEWLLDSVTANKLLPWSDYKWPAFTSMNSPTQKLAPGTPVLTLSSRVMQDSPSSPNLTIALDFSSKQSRNNNTHPAFQVGSQNNQVIGIPSSESPFASVVNPELPESPLAELTRTLAPAPAAPGVASSLDTTHTTHSANPDAERLMESAEWREAHTSASGEAFIQGYYQHSRLHHLSKWKSELRSLVAKAQDDAEARFPSNASTVTENHSKGKARAGEKVIMHCDFDSFFVAAGIVSKPELKDKPIVVCHASGKGTAHSTSEIASASYAARAFGVKNGMRQVELEHNCDIF